MLTEVRKYLNLMHNYVFFNMKCIMEYRVSFMIGILSSIIINIFTLIFWWTIYQKIDIIGSYKLSDTLILIALIKSITGITGILLGNVRELSNLIMSAELDSFLLQPKDIILNTCMSRMEFNGFGDLLYGYIVLIVMRGLSITNLLVFTVLTYTGSIILFSTLIIINSLTFFIKNSDSTKRIIETFIMTISEYPEDIFTNSLRFLFYTIMPIGFMVYLPVKIIESLCITKILVVLFMSLIYLLFAYLVFYSGLKRYESGNLINTKI